MTKMTNLYRRMLLCGMILFIAFYAVSMTLTEAKPVIDNVSPDSVHNPGKDFNHVDPGSKTGSSFVPAGADGNKYINPGSKGNPDDKNKNQIPENQVQIDRNVNPSGYSGDKFVRNPTGQSWSYEGQPSGQVITYGGKTGFNNGWLRGDNWWNSGTKLTESYSYRPWPNGMDNGWAFNWGTYQTSTGTYVIGIYPDQQAGYADIVLCNPDQVADPLSGFNFIVGNTLYTFQSNDWIAAHGTADLKVKVPYGSIIQIQETKNNVVYYIAQILWKNTGLQIGSDWQVYQAPTGISVNYFSQYNGLYETA